MGPFLLLDIVLVQPEGLRQRSYMPFDIPTPRGTSACITVDVAVLVVVRFVGAHPVHVEVTKEFDEPGPILGADVILNGPVRGHVLRNEQALGIFLVCAEVRNSSQGK